MTARLSGLTIGALTIEPTFNPDIESYAATTSNNSNTVTARPENDDATVKITLNDKTNVSNGSAATWDDGENMLSIKVTNGAANKNYTVTVTKNTG